jgi:hypothetical protein
MRQGGFTRKAVFYLFLFVASPYVWGDERLKLILNSKEVINDIKWDSSKNTQEPVLETKTDSKGTASYFVTLRGNYSVKNGDLLFNNQKLTVGAKGDFSMEVGIDSEEQSFVLLAVDDTGNTQTQKGKLKFPEWEKFKKASLPPDLPTGSSPSIKAYSIRAELGWTTLAYQQSGTDLTTVQLMQLGLTARVSGSYKLPFTSWLPIGSLEMITLPFFTSNSTLGSLHLFNLKLGLEKDLPFLKTPWSLKVRSTYFYSTSFTSGDFGYVQAMGPQITPVVFRELEGNRMLSFYFSYAPILNSYLALSSRQMGIGFGYLFYPGSSSHQVGIHFDLSTLRLDLLTIGYSEATTIHLGGSYSF